MESPNAAEHRKMAETLLLFIRQRMGQGNFSGPVDVLVMGGLDEAVEGWLLGELNENRERVRLVRAVASLDESRRWIEFFGSRLPGAQVVLLDMGSDVLQQGRMAGEFEAVVVAGMEEWLSGGMESLVNLKRMLKGNGLLILEGEAGMAQKWKEALAGAGFLKIKAKSDGYQDKTLLKRDLFMARSDGQVLTTGARTGEKNAVVADIEKSSSNQPDSKESIREQLTVVLGRVLEIPPVEIDGKTPFAEFGVDSIVGVAFVEELNRQFGTELKPTVLFDYGCVEKLAAYLAEKCQVKSAAPIQEAKVVSFGQPIETASAAVLKTDVAIIGMSGRFPGAANVGEFWRNLAAGRNCIVEVPSDRWDHSRFYDPAGRRTNKTNAKWGGFLEDADKFDPLFFKISGREAEITDPQHRLFIEESYHALEDAGYIGPSAHVARKCGVFAGVEPGDYLHSLMELKDRRENAPVFQGNAESILAARISYFLDLKGPSIAINTACSSSLVAIHLAWQSLATGECDLALAGGVRVFSAGKSYLALSNMGMLSPDGQCKTFDESANGFVPGEAAGVVVLKPLAAALRDGDHVYGVIKGSAINQDGRTNGITAPSSLSQTQVELEVYEKFGLSPESFQYVEAHGTGTKLGDPIEIQALTESFRKFTSARQFCAIGSVKTNLGHTLAASGVCSMIKVLLSLQNRRLAPSLNLRKINPYIDFANSPFFVNTALREWTAPDGRPRRAAISSFGFSGTNCHLVVEEAPAAEQRGSVKNKPAWLITLSAKTSEALSRRQRDLLAWLETHPDASLEDVSFTLNLGREHLEMRWAAVAGSTDELRGMLRVGGGETPAAPPVTEDEKVYREKLAVLKDQYLEGRELDWEGLHRNEPHRRISLPTYPFAKERYWLPVESPAEQVEISGPFAPHPLVQRDVSTSGQTQYAVVFNGEEFFLADHQIGGKKILPGVAYLEMAVAAVRQIMRGDSFALSNLAWMRPLTVEGEKEVLIRLTPEGQAVRFEVVSDHGRTVHVQGKAVRNQGGLSLQCNPDEIKARCAKTADGGEIYQRCADAGLWFGERFRAVRQVWFAEDEALSLLELPAALGGGANAFTLHPVLMDGALQTTAVLGGGGGLPVPFAVAEVVFSPLPARCYAHVRREKTRQGLRRYEVVLMDESGRAVVRLDGMVMRALPSESGKSAREDAGGDSLPVQPAAAETTGDRRDVFLGYLAEQFAKLVKLPVSRIRPKDALEKYGIDSIMVMEFTQRLEETFGELPKTLLFEHQTLAELADYFLTHHSGKVDALLGETLKKTTGVSTAETGAAEDWPVMKSPADKVRDARPVPAGGEEEIAIVGLFGRYPMADDPDQFWDNLRNGRDCITKIPPERWDYRLFYDPAPGRPGKTRNKWGGFLKDVDRFDAQFFSVMPREAVALDPQERLFLETVWRTVEDAGYSRSALANRKVGVFVGVMYGEYQLYGAGDVRQGKVFPLSSSYASIANRVSYFFNWHGPSLALDTMCSSSLTAIHLACASLRRGESEAAVAGGVNTTLHPHKDILLAPGGFASSDGRCHSFGEGGDGYVPGEGVGAVLLKTLSRALADGDHIYAVIKGSAVNHGGKTNGYTVPNPKAQAELIRTALAETGVEPRSIQYIEAHGTGTSLGDPIEIASLTKAFQQAPGTGAPERQSCMVGSVKSNIGHLESAAGIAAVTKVLLQLRHGQIVPSLHSEKLNPNIRFDETPFEVARTLRDWPAIKLRKDGVERRQPRRAGISSFGAGGANAHLIVEEFMGEARREGKIEGPFLFVLSARKPDRLMARARQLLEFLRQRESLGFPAHFLADMAFTLQAGREPLEERLAFVANSGTEAMARLRQFVNGEAGPGLWRGTVQPARAEAMPWLEGGEGKAFLGAEKSRRKWDRLAQAWVEGGQVDWEVFYREGGVCRMSLPTYPFAGERYWAPDNPNFAPSAPVAAAQPALVLKAPSGDALDEKPSALLLRPVWKKSAEVALPAEQARGVLWLFDAEENLRREIERKFPALSVTRIFPAENFGQEGKTIWLNPSFDDDYRRLVETGCPDLVIHRWACTPRDPGHALEVGLYSSFRLARSLMQRGVRKDVRMLFCHPVKESPAFSAVSGLARTLAQEQPRLQLRMLQTETAGLELVAELFAGEMEREIRRQQGKREVRIFEPFEMAAGTGGVLRKNGVYLITGGMGGLGRIFAGHLAVHYQARLVLTGRSALNDEMRAVIQGIEKSGAEILYAQGDISRHEDAQKIVRQARERFGGLNGVVHAAGVIKDALILNKNTADFSAVMTPKAQGALALDEATKAESLDFFVLFSSAAGFFGNVGQADYASANAFLDAFARVREVQRRAGERRGKTVSINWPLWKEGGMQMGGGSKQAQLEKLGIFALPKEAGVPIFEQALQGNETGFVPLWGIRRLLEKTLFGREMTGEEKRAPVKLAEADFLPRVEAYLKQTLAKVTQLPAADIDIEQRFEQLGVDSIVVNDFNLQLEKDLGEMPKTLLYEHQTIQLLANHLLAAYPSQLARFFGQGGIPDAGRKEMETRSVAAEPAALPEKSKVVQENAGVSSAAAPFSRSTEDIAIIGLSGRYPQARDVRAFWEALKSGRDCVTEIPKERWDIEEYYDPDPAKAIEGKMYARWGAFLDQVDQFDPLFFGLPPVEAELMDPQERLFLETTWMTLEDAGYTRKDLRRRVRKEYAASVGVFVGVTNNSYQLVSHDQGGDRMLPTSLPWSLANRISYLFNFNGPSIPVDTACSSSLTAIHLACEAIRRGECQQALAGGVNLYLHPSKYVAMCLVKMLSTQGRCNTFGAGGDGFVPGEGVGAVLLKPLSLARADGDHVYGVIKGTAVNHGGRTNGYTVPNPVAQAELIARVLREGRIDPRTLGYIEAHGTGTSLGDPIEVAGLVKAFADAAGGAPGSAEPWCALGSAKSNIGHLEAAAGIAGLTKVLLQMKHRQLAPSLHAEQLNPKITFAGTPFRVQRELAEWQPLRKAGAADLLRAGISSFGAGGANAHVVVEEYREEVGGKVQGFRGQGTEGQRVEVEEPALIVLSARQREQLKVYAGNLRQFLMETPAEETPLQWMAFTLQVGREAFEERLAFVVSSREDLLLKLERVARETALPEEFFSGRVKKERVQIVAEGQAKTVDAAAMEAVKAGDLAQIAKCWVGGSEIDWREFHRGKGARRVSLPTYPFARQRYWLPEIRKTGVATGAARLHPLAHRNESTLREIVFKSRFSGNEPVFKDHQVGGQAIMPGAATLELALAGLRLAGGITKPQLRNVVWTRPVKALPEGTEIALRFYPETGGNARFELCDRNGEVLVQGKGVMAEAVAPANLDWTAIRSRCSQTMAASALYDGFAERGLKYGEGFRVIRELGYGQDEVWISLSVPPVWKGEDYRLHPALLDGALQSLALLGAGQNGVEIPYAVGEVLEWKKLPDQCLAYCRVKVDEKGARRYEVQLADAQGRVLACLRNVSFRRVDQPARAERASKEPVAAAKVVASPAIKADGEGAPDVRLMADLKQMVAKVLRLDLSVLDEESDLSEYGFDSITFTSLCNEINQAWGLEMTPAILFEHQTLKSFADFLWKEHDAVLGKYYQAVAPTVETARDVSAGEEAVEAPVFSDGEISSEAHVRPGREPVAVIGMSGAFPGSPDLDKFWQNLEEGKDLITRAPSERWVFPRGALPAEALREIPWGGFVEGVDQFDPLFFDISPREAELMDPQQRMLLQMVWKAMEDAGYRKTDLAGTRTGLFVGVAANDYANLLAMNGIPVEAYSSTGNAHSVLANRVSYFFDLRGPSEAIDTACSSSLVAIHRAVESMESGSSDMAIVSGVNVLLNPAVFMAFNKAGMLSPDGRCKTFDERANGYVRGEGIGVIVLKPLSRAKRDGDPIHGVILGSAENHGGHVQSLTVPNPNAQAQLLREAFARAGVSPWSVGCIEAHGTGTSLGDPIEVNGLKKAFGKNTGGIPQPRCAVGSVKTNIGHLETAAGIAGVIKALLAMRHRRIPGNAHLRKLNPYIQVADTPFYFPQHAEPWEPLRDAQGRPLPRRAGVSSFGFGGANAHVVLEEYREEVGGKVQGFRGQGTEGQRVEVEEPALIVFSARDEVRLREVAENLAAFVKGQLETERIGEAVEKISLRQMAYTLQAGRQPMDARLALIVSSQAELAEKLGGFLQGGKDIVGLHLGNVAANKNAVHLLRQIQDDRQMTAPLLAGRQLAKLAQLWVAGVEIDWKTMYQGGRMTRVNLPTYPFARDRYWVPAVKHSAGGAKAEGLHPLVQRNESDLKGVCFSGSFSGEEIVLRDHQVGGEKIMPGAAILEMALAGARLATGSDEVVLREVAWVRPLKAGSQGVEVRQYWRPAEHGGAVFEVRQADGTLLSQGRCEAGKTFEKETLDAAGIRERCGRKIDPSKFYAGFAERGLVYGEGYRVIGEIGVGQGEVWCRMETPAVWGGEAWRLHPALLDGALQSLAAIRKDDDGLELPFAVREVWCGGVLPSKCQAYGRIEEDTGGVRRFEIKLMDENGVVMARLGGLTVRRFGRLEGETLYYRPVWKSQAVRTDGLPAAGTCLLFDEASDLADELRRSGVRVVRVTPGEAWQSDGQTVAMRRDQDEDYHRLLGEVKFDWVIHRWARADAGLDDALARGIFSLHRLVRAGLKGKFKGVGRILFVYPAGEAVCEAAAGYAKSLRFEQPQLRVKTVGVEGALPTAAEWLGELEDESFEVRYREGKREARTLEEITPGALAQPLPLKQGGVYLLTGGAGGLGMIFAGYLLEKWDARLVLAGRSELGDEKRRQLESFGGKIHYCRADVSDPEGARRAVGEARERFGRLDGVIHAAGVLRDALIWRLKEDDFSAVLQPKLTGAQALDDAIGDEPLDFFVLFSSMAGLLGNAGQGNYAYANACLDAFARRRALSRKNGGRTLSINWPLWRDGGMQAGDGGKRSEQGLGVAALGRTDGLKIFENALRSGEAQVWGCVGNRERIQMLLLGGTPKPGIAHPSAEPVAAAAMAGDRTHEAIRDFLVAQLAVLIKMPPSQIKTGEPLEKYGFDSIMAAEFGGILEKEFGETSKTLVFEYPTVEALTRYFHARQAKRTEPAGETAKPAEPVAATAVENAVAGGGLKQCRSMALAPMDYLFVGRQRLAIQVLYYFEEALDYEHLRKGLQKAGELFYPVNSELTPSGEREYLISECRDEPDFQEIICEPEVKLPQPDHPETTAPFHVDFDPTLPGEKLARFRLFQLARGSVLSVNMSHAIADGYSFYYFMSAWAAICRGAAFLPPEHARRVLGELVRDYRAKRERRDAGLGGEVEWTIPLLAPDTDPTTDQIETLILDAAALMAEARAGAQGHEAAKLTENSVVTAKLWKLYAQTLPADAGELTLACPVNFRRNSGKLTHAYFGNAATPAIVRRERERVLNDSLASLAAQITDAVRACDESTLLSFNAAIDDLRRGKGLDAMNRAALVDPQRGLIVTNVARFPLPPIDFGSGPFRQEFSAENYAGTAVMISAEGSMFKVRLGYPRRMADRAAPAG
ncbi:MAG: SDR family NAD(P)-dependent oxidoreductase [Verrucomicrobiae bacterium]|nr:SDR family NAD(P)-dependent oxidoreductase [Verrucomicrobiae bacterium]